MNEYAQFLPVASPATYTPRNVIFFFGWTIVSTFNHMVDVNGDRITSPTFISDADLVCFMVILSFRRRNQFAL